ncbi:hypothetical protein BDQ17DRAFT_1436868 [Cyathus striatus]|nr:hypothetical protein BDQ17DRAFT_1436868 [Cyathus striatus]
MPSSAVMQTRTDLGPLRERIVNMEQEPGPPTEWEFVIQFFVNCETREHSGGLVEGGNSEEPEEGGHSSTELAYDNNKAGDSNIEGEGNSAELADDDNEAGDSNIEGEDNPSNDFEGESNLANDYVKKHWVPLSLEATQEGHAALHQILNP